MSQTFRSPTSAEEEDVYAKISRRLVPFLLMCLCVAFLDRINIGFAKQEMGADLGLSAAAYGLGAGIFFIGYFIFEVPSNLLMTKIGAKRTMSRIMILWGMTSSCTMFVTSETSFYFLRFLLGVFEAGFAPGLTLYLTYWFTSKRRARMTALVLLSIPISGMIGAPLSGAIISGMHDVWGFAGWQWMFLLEGIPSVVLGLLVWKVLADSPADADWLNDREKALVIRALDEEKAAVSRSGGHHNFLASLKDLRVWMLAFIYFAMNCSLYLLTFWMPTILSGLGKFSSFKLGLLVAIPYGFAMVVMIINGKSSDRTQERRWHTIIPALFGTVALVATTIVASPIANLVLFSIATAGTLSVIAVFFTFPPKLLTGVAVAGGIALINSIGSLGGFVTPYVTGLLVDRTGSPSSAIYVISAMVGLALILVYGVSGERPRKHIASQIPGRAVSEAEKIIVRPMN